jgi:ABC-type antimicrobial peptide transport system permease subunit
VRQWLTECLLLAIAGGFAGLLAAYWITGLLLHFVPEKDRTSLQFHASPGVVAFTVGLTLAAGLLFGLLPSIRASRVDVGTVLKPKFPEQIGLNPGASH